MDVRPVGRTSSSAKQMAWPSWVAMRIFWLPSVSFTAMRASPSSRVSARMPMFLRFFSVSTGRRFTVPFLVTMVRKRVSSVPER